MAINSLEKMLESLEPDVSNIPEESVDMKIQEHEYEASEPEEVDDEIPERFYTDSRVVGYDDPQLQADVYNLALYGKLPITGKLSILDVGAGRGDLYFHVVNMLPTLDVTYTGIEKNGILAQVGNNKFKDFETATIINSEFLDLQDETIGQYDIVSIIGSLNINYGWDENNWTLLEKIIDKSVSLAKEKVVLVLLHDNGGVDDYISYPIPNLSELVLKYNYPFDISYGALANVYSVTINTTINNFIE